MSEIEIYGKKYRYYYDVPGLLVSEDEHYNNRVHPNSDWKELFHEEDEVMINVKTKEIKQNGAIVPTRNEIYDSDIDQTVSVEDYVYLDIKTKYGVNRQRFTVTQLLNQVL